jgi:hypothetical protein
MLFIKKVFNDYVAEKIAVNISLVDCAKNEKITLTLSWD